MEKLHIGTCSWKYPSWAGLVYSAPTGIDYLREYAQKYTTVEIDQWFWSLFEGGKVQLPKTTDVESYARAVPKSFTFTIKAPNSVSLTHPYQGASDGPVAANPFFLSAAVMRDLYERLEPLREQIGMLFLQFEYLNRQKMASQQQFQQRVQEFRAQLPAGPPLGLEIRNSTWLNATFFEFLLAAGIHPVLLQGYWMPPVTQVYEKHRALIVRHPTLMLRLMGADRQGIEKEAAGSWDRVLWSKEQELLGIAEMIRDILAAGVELYVNINNHYEGSAPRTIARLLELLDV
ncbi:MAG TPA: DUF72 domain-containing protein [bacterium]|nr:DUF72 domain-containing protein [bacterium]HQG44154.1 DUF72 domain-containing protein [bacterium]HQJ64880.1 DUF72 domain-containing protein [bacterium]